MADFDVEAIRAEVRALRFTRGSLAESAMWRGDDADSRANLAIESMNLTPNEEAFFDMLGDEAVPPPLATQILLRLLDHPDADRSLPITPLAKAG